MKLDELMQRIQRIEPAVATAQSGAQGAQRIVLATLHALRQALNECTPDERMALPGLGQFRVRKDRQQAPAGALRRMVFSPEDSARTTRVDELAPPAAAAQPEAQPSA
ncbi:hypothetical protein [Ideonella sp.]|uniref:hypothetical protein n=1 Tax=Ideonella sp. TaxID=1929293 RepID=UPI0035AE6B0D